MEQNEQEQKTAEVAVRNNEAQPPITMTPNKEAWDIAQRQAMAWSKSTIVPKDYQGSVSNCLVALEMAHRINMSPMQVMQNLYLVHNRPGWSSTFLIASVNACGKFSSLRYEERGDIFSDDYAVRAWATEKAGGERLNGTWITWEMVKAEGWLNKAGSKWKTMPDQMFKYRAAAFWQRAYAPEISMGLQTTEEVADVEPTPVPAGTMKVSPSPKQIAQAKDEIRHKVLTVDLFKQKFSGLTPEQEAELREIEDAA